MSRRSRRAELIDSGVNVLHRWGYTAASIDRIAESAGVSKGAFFVHFDSKETFTVEVLRHYFYRWRDYVEKIMDDPDMSAVSKLRAMLAAITDNAVIAPYVSGSLIGNISAELSDEYGSIRSTIAKIFLDWAEPLETVIEAGQKAGEFNGAVPALAARFIVNSLQGALLRCKVDRASTALDDFEEVVFNVLLRSKDPGSRKRIVTEGAIHKVDECPSLAK